MYEKELTSSTKFARLYDFEENNFERLKEILVKAVNLVAYLDSLPSSSYEKYAYNVFLQQMFLFRGGLWLTYSQSKHDPPEYKNLSKYFENLLYYFGVTEITVLEVAPGDSFHYYVEKLKHESNKCEICNRAKNVYNSSDLFALVLNPDIGTYSLLVISSNQELSLEQIAKPYASKPSVENSSLIIADNILVNSGGLVVTNNHIKKPDFVFIEKPRTQFKLVQNLLTLLSA